MPKHKSVPLCIGLVLLVLPISVLGSEPAFAECSSGLISYWRLDEQGGSVFSDSYGASDGECFANCPAPIAGGVILGAQSFDGTTSRIDVAPHSSFNWSSDDSFSIEYWIRREPASQSSREVVAGRSDSSSGWFWWSGVEASGEASFVLIDESRSGSEDHQKLKGYTNLRDGGWHHIVAVRDAGNKWNVLYVDGRLEDAAFVEYNGDFASHTAQLNIGWTSRDNGYYFGGELDELALHDRSLTDREVLQHYHDGTVGLQWGYCGCSREVKVMPLGDSITAGKNDALTDPGYMVGYRRKLYFDLIDQGYPVDFVGSQSHGYLAQSSFDFDNEGQMGWTAAQMASNVNGLLVNNPTDIILLHIGTNDLDTSPADVENILEEIDRYDENVTVLLALIINRRTASLETTLFNDNLRSMAINRIRNGDKIIIVDQENTLVYPDDMEDYLHPNIFGFEKMAATWLHALEYVLPSCGPVSLYPPEIISTPVVRTPISISYNYDVDALSNPPPSYSLMNSPHPVPQGMTIDENTGMIQ